ncbi:MAG: DUF6504 family protein [Dehalococcoidia bacterium]
MVEDPRTAAGARRFRALNEPVPAAVEATANGAPKAILWRGAYLRVAALHDTWRVDDEWWREEIARRYFVVELEGGRRLTIYHDLVHDLWYAQPYEAPRDKRRTG